MRGPCSTLVGSAHAFRESPIEVVAAGYSGSMPYGPSRYTGRGRATIERVELVDAYNDEDPDELLAWYDRGASGTTAVGQTWARATGW